mmetsp:Transcript_10084/g.20819  ORF Transcript_10084/g.20819 Transcript_10084/m.20819 type:complete len:453 (-) Transcript_10084:36-1394(-)
MKHHVQKKDKDNENHEDYDDDDPDDEEDEVLTPTNHVVGLNDVNKEKGILHQKGHRIMASSNSADENAEQCQRQKQEEHDSDKSEDEPFSCGDLIRKIRYNCGRLVYNERVQWFMNTLIFLNAIMLGIGTADFVQDNPRIKRAFDVFHLVVQCFFTLDCGLLIVYFSWRVFMDFWVVTEILLVGLIWMQPEAQIFRTVLVFRVVLSADLTILRQLAYSILLAANQLTGIAGGILVFMLVLIYIFAVAGTYLFGDYYERGIFEQDYFGRLDKSMLTLYEITAGEGWSEISRNASTENSWNALFFLLFAFFQTFIMFNLFLAAVLDKFSDVLSSIEEEAKNQQKARRGVSSEREEDDDDDVLEEEYNILPSSTTPTTTTTAANAVPQKQSSEESSQLKHEIVALKDVILALNENYTTQKLEMAALQKEILLLKGSIQLLLTQQTTAKTKDLSDK